MIVCIENIELMLTNYKKIWLFPFFLIWLTCTNPFSLREAEPPLDISGSDQRLQLQLNPDSLMFKMQLAFKEKDNQLYQDLFARESIDSVSYTFKAGYYYLDRLNNWTLQDEFGYFDNLIKDKNILTLQLELNKSKEWVTVSNDPDSLQSQYFYKITLKENNIVQVYSGDALFKIYRASDSYYRIYYWEDIINSANEADSSWSALKARFRINE